MHDREEIAGDIGIHIITEDKLTQRIVHPGTVGGDHKRLDPQTVAHLRDIDMVTSGGEDEVHPFLGQQAQGFPGKGGQGMRGRQQGAVHIRSYDMIHRVRSNLSWGWRQ